MRSAVPALLAGLALLALLAGCQPEEGQTVPAAATAPDKALEAVPAAPPGPPALLSDPGAVTEGSLRASDGKGGVVECPLKHTDVRADIAGMIARVRVTQTFHNPFQRVIEAIYAFPLSHTGAVDEMTMIIGERRIVGQIKRRAEAEQIYKEAIAKGQTASLLSQERPNIFTQTVGNIPPGQEVKIEIAYVDVLRFDKNEYEFQFPMVVGPRYIPGAATSAAPAIAPEQQGKVGEVEPPKDAHETPKGEGWSPDTDQVPDASRITPPVLKPEWRTGHDISLSVGLEAGMPILELQAAAHKVAWVFDRPSHAEVKLSPSDSIPNKDFVLRYRLAGEKPEVAVLARGTGEGHGWFLATIQPRIGQVAGAAPPRDVCFLVDVSGSMSGAPLEKSKKAMELLLERMRPQDRFQVVLFAQQARKAFVNFVPVDADSLKKAREAVSVQRGGGGTEMLQGVRAALADPDPSRMRIVLMLTDGFIGNEAAVIEAAKNAHAENVRFWVVGIGSSPNRFLVKGVADVGGGMGETLGLADDPKPLIEKIAARMQRAQIGGIELDWGGLQVAELFPPKVPDLWSEAPVVLHGVFLAPGEGTLTVRGTMEGAPVVLKQKVAFPASKAGNDALANVWARRKIEALDIARQGAWEEEITAVALEYRLVSAYTSFVAVEEQVVPGADGAPPERKMVPVPVPEGTSFEGLFGVEDAISNQPFQGRYWNSAIGIGGGAGGSFGGRFGGKRNLRAYGGGTHTESSVMMGLVWLKNHQSPDGSWSSAKFPMNCKKGTCAGPGSGSDLETTAISLLAFLGAGHTHKHGKFKNTVKDALKFLKDKQNADGSFGGEGGTAQDLRAHAVCTMAAAEAYGLTGQSPLLTGMGQKAVDFLVSVQQANSGWAAKKGGAPDTVSTGWAVLALKAAKLSGLNVPKDSFDAALKWFDAMMDATTYGTAFASPGDRGVDKDLPGANALASTAAATIGRVFILGNAAANRPETLGGGNLLKQSPPKWNLADKTVDEEYWYFGTLAMFQMGRDYWKAWNEPMKNAIVPTQKREGCENGSWDPVGARGAKMGRVWSTAIHALSLEIYYRYGRVLNVRDEAPAVPPATESKAETPPESKGEEKKNE